MRRRAAIVKRRTRTGVAMGLFWDDFEAGGEWITGERVIEPADLERFSELSGDVNPLHLDDGYAREAGFEGLAVATGLLNRLGLTAGTLVALLGTAWRFERPLYPGTAVRLHVEFGEKRESRRPGRGVVVLRCELRDGEGVTYQRGEVTMLVRRKR
jgi:acyl dehydratase